MTLWKSKLSFDSAQVFFKDTLVEHLGIRIAEIGDDYIKAVMTLDRSFPQPCFLPYNCAIVAFAEAVGNIAGQLAVKPGYHCYGKGINANLIHNVKEGRVTAIAVPVKLNHQRQIWDISINNEDEKTICLSRLSLAVVRRIDPVLGTGSG